MISMINFLHDRQHVAVDIHVIRLTNCNVITRREVHRNQTVNQQQEAIWFSLSPKLKEMASKCESICSVAS